MLRVDVVVWDVMICLIDYIVDVLFSRNLIGASLRHCFSTSFWKGCLHHHTLLTQFIEQTRKIAVPKSNLLFRTPTSELKARTLELLTRTLELLAAIFLFRTRTSELLTPLLQEKDRKLLFLTPTFEFEGRKREFGTPICYPKPQWAGLLPRNPRAEAPLSSLISLA
jgi:hypothetical protein